MLDQLERLPADTILGLAAACRAVNPQLAVQCCATLTEALAAVTEERLVVIGGSLYLIGEAMERLQLAPSLPGDERALNEWTGGSINRG